MSEEVDMEKLIGNIVSETGKGKGEVEEMIKAKEEELGNMVTRSAAGLIVARELGVEPGTKVASTEVVDSLPLEGIVEGMKSASAVVRILRKFPVRKFTRKDGGVGQVGNAIVGDHTGTTRAVFWDSATGLMDSFGEGDTVHLIDAYTKKRDDGAVELHMGRRARIEVNPEGRDVPEPTPERKKVSELSTSDSFVEVLAVVATVRDTKEFERKDSTPGKVRHVGLADDTGSVKLVLWDDETTLEVAEEDTVLVSGAYVRDSGYGTELHLGSTGKVAVNPGGESPPGADLEKARGDLGGQTAVRKVAEDLEVGDVAEVRGTLVDIKEPHEYTKDGERGAVLTATLDDGTDAVRVTVFGQLFGEVLGKSLEEVVEMEEEEWESTRRRSLGREIVVTGKVQNNEFLNDIEIVARGISKADPGKELKRLTENVSPPS